MQPLLSSQIAPSMMDRVVATIIKLDILSDYMEERCIRFSCRIFPHSDIFPKDSYM